MPVAKYNRVSSTSSSTSPAAGSYVYVSNARNIKDAAWTAWIEKTCTFSLPVLGKHRANDVDINPRPCKRLRVRAPMKQVLGKRAAAEEDINLRARKVIRTREPSTPLRLVMERPGPKIRIALNFHEGEELSLWEGAEGYFPVDPVLAARKAEPFGEWFIEACENFMRVPEPENASAVVESTEEAGMDVEEDENASVSESTDELMGENIGASESDIMDASESETMDASESVNMDVSGDDVVVSIERPITGASADDAMDDGEGDDDEVVEDQDQANVGQGGVPMDTQSEADVQEDEEEEEEEEVEEDEEEEEAEEDEEEEEAEEEEEEDEEHGESGDDSVSVVDDDQPEAPTMEHTFREPHAEDDSSDGSNSDSEGGLDFDDGDSDGQYFENDDDNLAGSATVEKSDQEQGRDQPPSKSLEELRKLDQPLPPPVWRYTTADMEARKMKAEPARQARVAGHGHPYSRPAMRNAAAGTRSSARLGSSSSRTASSLLPPRPISAYGTPIELLAPNTAATRAEDAARQEAAAAKLRDTNLPIILGKYNGVPVPLPGKRHGPQQKRDAEKALKAEEDMSTVVGLMNNNGVTERDDNDEYHQLASELTKTETAQRSLQSRLNALEGERETGFALKHAQATRAPRRSTRPATVASSEESDAKSRKASEQASRRTRDARSRSPPRSR
ncbi:MAG: hypothetical protein M1828_004959 [Chrysothrix sp. TS-e1954]|nr:MAG: hypothetical protein M1828_004959 [Chrysothrix sp. TS-e1954]